MKNTPRNFETEFAAGALIGLFIIVAIVAANLFFFNA